MASLGSKVLQIRSVEFAGKYKVPLRVLSSFDEGEGTLITFEEEAVEEAQIAGIAFNRDEAKLTVLGGAGPARRRPQDPGADRRCQYRGRHDRPERGPRRGDHRFHLHGPSQRL